MARLSKFRLTEAAFNGDWVSVGPEEDPYRVKVRGLTDAITDKINIRLQRAALDLNRQAMQERRKTGQIIWTAQNLPRSIADRVEAEVIVEDCIMDIDGLFHDPPEGAAPGAVGPKVEIEEYREMILDPYFKDLYYHAWLAVQKVTQARAGDPETEEKNSRTTSNGS